jgi:PAS domain S-box-containing protein
MSAINDGALSNKADQTFRDLLESAPDAMIIVNRSGEMVLVNSQAVKMFGWSREELLGNAIEMLVPTRFRNQHPGHRDGFFAQSRTRAKGAGLDLLGLRKDRTEFPAEITLSPLETGEGLFVSSAIRDVTGRKRFEQVLRDNHLELENPASSKDRFLVGKEGEGRFAAEDERVAVALAAQVAAAYENAALYETVQRHAVRLQIAMHQREQADLELKESEQRFRQMAENIREVFFLTDPAATKMLYISPAYADIWGRSCESLYEDPRSWTDAIHPDDRERAFAVFGQMEAKGQFDLEYRIQRPDGDVRWIRARGFPIRNDAGETYRVAGIAEDVTNRKTTAEDLARSNRALTMLSRCNEILIRAVDEASLLQNVCQVAVEIGGYRVARVAFALDDAAKSIVIKAHAGELQPFHATLRQSWRTDMSEGPSPLGEAIRSGKVQVVDNLADEPSLSAIANQIRAADYHGCVVLPLQNAERAFGLLILYCAESNPVNADELRLLRELADDLAFGILSIRARAERDRAEESLVASLRDKGALLKEVHHRVKNNLQVITSLLRLEARRVENPGTRIVLRDMQNRVHAMAALHERLYRSNSFAEIEIGPYIGQLVEQLVRSVAPNPEKITIQLDVASVRLGLDQAVPCGLLVTELVSNALKHAFPESRKGILLIELRSVDETHLTLRVRDDGIGLPEDFEARRQESLGLQLATDLSRQIGGALEIERGQGTSFQVTFARTNGEEARRLREPLV